jgi:hypothetical protein
VRKLSVAGAIKMETYNPSVEQSKEEWLCATESERLAAVMEYHENSGVDIDEKALTIHATIHVIVENQLAMGVDLLPETIAKLIRQGLTRHEAIHAVGAILIEDIMDIMCGEISEFSAKRYRKKLEKITAKRWKKGQY